MSPMREIRLGVGRTRNWAGPGSGHVSLIDDASFEQVSQFPWHVVKGHAGVLYAERKWRGEDGRPCTQRMHQLITGILGTDHIDHDGLNNQWFNFRVATLPQNAWNTRKRVPSTSRYKGVSWQRNRQSGGRWIACIWADGRQRYLGRFADEVGAALAYDTAAREVFGPFACVNFPKSGEQGALPASPGLERPVSLDLDQYAEEGQMDGGVVLCVVCGDEAGGQCASCDRDLCEAHLRTTAVPGDSFCLPGEGCSPKPYG